MHSKGILSQWDLGRDQQPHCYQHQRHPPPGSSALLGYECDALCHYVVSCRFSAALPTHQNDIELGLREQTGVMMISP